MVLAGRTKLRVSKNFFRGDIFLYLLNIFATAIPKLKQKISKIKVQIVNHRNWLDDSPPLMKFSRRNEKDFFGWQNKRLSLYNTSSFGQIMGTFLHAKTYTLRRYRLKMEMIAVTATFLLPYVILVILFLFSQKIYHDIICLLRIVVFVGKFG